MNETVAQIAEDVAIAALVIAATPRRTEQAPAAPAAKRFAPRKERQSWVPSRNIAERR